MEACLERRRHFTPRLSTQWMVCYDTSPKPSRNIYGSQGEACKQMGEVLFSSMRMHQCSTKYRHCSRHTHLYRRGSRFPVPKTAQAAEDTPCRTASTTTVTSHSIVVCTKNGNDSYLLLTTSLVCMVKLILPGLWQVLEMDSASSK